MEQSANKTYEEQTPGAAPEQAARKPRRRWVRGMALFLALIMVGSTVLSLASTAKIAKENGTSLRNNVAYECLVQGLEYLEMERYEQALEYLQVTLDIWPSSPEAYTAKAAVYIATAENEKAMENLEAALELYGEDAPSEILLQMASLCVLEGRSEEAIPLLERVTAQAPEEANGWLLLGQLYYEKEDYAPAVGCFDEYLKTDPENATALAVRAACRSGSGDEEGAMEDLIKAARYAEDDPTIRTALAEVYLSLGDFENAIGAYRLALEAAPEDTALRRALASCLLYTGGVEEAALLFEEALTMMSDEEKKGEEGQVARFSLAVALLQSGKAEEAASLFEALLEEGYETDTVKTQLGECYAALGRAEEAFVLWDELLEGSTLADSDLAYVALKACAVALQEGDAKGCIAYATQCLEGPQPDLTAHLYRASAYIETGEYQKAVEDMDVLLALDDQNAQFRYYRGVAYLNLGQLAKARQDFNVCAASAAEPELAASAREVLAQMG